MAKKPDHESQATSIMNRIVAGKLKVFHAPDGEPYVIIPKGKGREIWHLESSQVRAWIARTYFDVLGTVPSGAGIRDALQALKGLALASTEERVWIRTASEGSDLYLDLCNREWESIRIHNGEWSICLKAPVYLRRTPAMLSLPTPVRGGDFTLFRRYVNIQDDKQWLLLRAWITSAYRPFGPFPVLVLSGVQGSAKSTCADFCRRVIDPHVANIRQEPKSKLDLIIAADNSWVLAYDNLSRLEQELSDAFCCLATGTGFTARRLFTDREESIFAAVRPIITTSIDDVVTRGDLLDRAILLNLPTLLPDQRRSMLSLVTAFEQDLPLILGGAMDYVAAAQKRYRWVKDTDLPRMADWARWGIALEQALSEPDGQFMEAYMENLKQGRQTALEGTLLVQPLVALVEKWGLWEGTAEKLLADLRDFYIGVPDPSQWPKLPNQLRNRLNRLAPHLPLVDVHVRFVVNRGSKLIRLWRSSHQGIDTIDTPENPFAS